MDVLVTATRTTGETSGVLSSLSDEELLREVARRKANRFKLAGATKKIEVNGESTSVSAPSCDDTTMWR